MPKERAQIVYWHTKEGRQRLFESKFHQAFFMLAHHFQPQMNPTHCGIASAVIALNHFRAGKQLRIDSNLHVDKPCGGTMCYDAYSQLTFLCPRTDKIKPRSQVEGKDKTQFDPGLNLDQLARKMRLHLLKVSVHHATETGEKPLRRFRHDLMAFLNDPDSVVIANFYGRALGKQGGGHISPLVAYHPQTDSCLVMDVAGHKYPWFWVRVETLYDAMHTKDGDAYRGWLIACDSLRR